MHSEFKISINHYISYVTAFLNIFGQMLKFISWFKKKKNFKQNHAAQTRKASWVSFKLRSGKFKGLVKFSHLRSLLNLYYSLLVTWMFSNQPYLFKDVDTLKFSLKMASVKVALKSNFPVLYVWTLSESTCCFHLPPQIWVRYKQGKSHFSTGKVAIFTDAITEHSQGPLSSYLEKVPWLRLVTCLLDFCRFQRCDWREGLES